MQQNCFQVAAHCKKLVLGIDDFAIRKGHSYNTGLHDLRGGSLLDIITGRTLEELRTYAQAHPLLKTLRPLAVVMDLAKYYHTFIQEMYPNAIRIADRFHVNRYVTDALQTIRKEVQHSLASRAAKQLKQHHRLLGKRHDQLLTDEQRLVKTLL